MAFDIVYIPKFKAVSSGVDTSFDFSKTGILGKFNDYFSSIQTEEKDSFLPRDFLYYDEVLKGLVWIFAVTEGLDTKGYETFDFEGGYYVIYTYRDGDDEENKRLYKEALLWIENQEMLSLDSRENHYPMGHIITPAEIIEVLGYAHMRSYIPIRIQKKSLE